MVFLILRVVPGSPARMLLPEGAPEPMVQELNRALGLSKPLVVQYRIFMVSVAKGEFGESFQYKVPALRVVKERFPATVQLGLVAMALTLVVAIPIGIISAARRGSLADYGTMSLAVLGQALPNFWLGIALILVFGVKLRWLPTSGNETLKHIILPAVTLAAYPVALIARLIRSNLLEVFSKDYVRTAWSKGLAEQQVIMRHALKNAAIPVVTVVGLLFGMLLGGAVITESVFAWPGIGKLVVDAILWRDYPIVQTVLILSATVFVGINLIIDVLYGLIDPRIKYE
jgi:peptide/nickel transport system permease protein